MKKIIAWILSLALALGMAGACAEPADSVFEQLAGLEWSFSSGAGAWSTDMRIGADGSFSAEYHDSEMGDVGEEYPDGVCYFCSFSGRLSVTEQVDEKTWKLKVESLETDDSQPEDRIEDGVRYLRAEPQGLAAGDEVVLYAPGTALSVLSEEMRLWTHAQDMENPPETISEELRR